NTYQSSVARVRAGAGKQKSPISALRSGGSRRLRFRNAARMLAGPRDGRGGEIARYRSASYSGAPGENSRPLPSEGNIDRGIPMKSTSYMITNGPPNSNLLLVLSHI